MVNVTPNAIQCLRVDLSIDSTMQAFAVNCCFVQLVKRENWGLIARSWSVFVLV